MKPSPLCSQHVFVTVKIITASGKQLAYASQSFPAYISAEMASEIAEKIIQDAEKATSKRES